MSATITTAEELARRRAERERQREERSRSILTCPLDDEHDQPSTPAFTAQQTETQR